MSTHCASFGTLKREGCLIDNKLSVLNDAGTLAHLGSSFCLEKDLRMLSEPMVVIATGDDAGCKFRILWRIGAFVGRVSHLGSYTLREALYHCTVRFFLVFFFF